MTNKIHNMDCGEGMKMLPDNSVDLTITSPPYDNLRTYNGYAWDFEATAKELYRVTKQGGVVVWIVADATIKGSETGTSFKQALFFMECGFNLHDTMIWAKPMFTAVGTLKTRYASTFEYMFVFSKGKPKTFNPIKDRKNIYAGHKKHGTIRQKDGSTRQVSNKGKRYEQYGIRFNVWNMSPVLSSRERRGHPAQFPVDLARDHIITWSNEGDTILDCFMGSGTTAEACIKNNRKYIGFEISKEYCEITEKRIKEIEQQLCV